MPTDDCIRLDDRQHIANFREQPIETNEYHSVAGAKGEFLWSSSPQNVDLLPQRPNLCLKHYPRPDQIDNHPTDEPAKIPHCARSSSDSRSPAKQDKVCDRDTMERTILRAIAFVLRCSGAATVAYELASSLGLHKALWAAMSALIVSQEQLHQTRSSLGGFISGTLLGIGCHCGS